MKTQLKVVLHAIFLTLACPLAVLSAFGRFEQPFRFGAHIVSRAPGLPGDYLRIAYYRLTLEKCALESRIDFGSYFVHTRARIGRRVYIGCNCIMGCTTIGDGTQIASGVQILSGRRQHPRDSQGRIQDSGSGAFETVSIGADCWIGAGSIVMADVGERATVGAGSIVVRPVVARAVAVGNPARTISIDGVSVKSGYGPDASSSPTF